MTTADPEPFKTLVQQRCGLSFDSRTENKLASAVDKRMHETNISSAALYLARLDQDQNEFQALINLLTINETYFFREPEQLRLVIESLVPQRLAVRESTQKVRLLSAGCSSGEEVYTLLMALWEVYDVRTPDWFEVIGGDIDTNILERAQAAVFGEFSFRGMDLARRQRFFDPISPGRFKIKEWLAPHASFHPLNLLSQTSNFSPFDVILYRNVSIYFDAPIRERILRHLATLLKPDGYLITGSSEIIGNDLGVLPLIEENGLFYFANRPLPPPAAPSLQLVAKPVRASQPPPVPSRPQPARKQPPTLEQPPPPTVQPSAPALETLMAEQRFDEALLAIDAELARTPQAGHALLLKSYVLLERRQFAAARTLAQQVVEQDSWSLDGWMLLGLIAKWENDSETATAAFKRVVYIQPDCWPAHYYLADLYHAADESQLAQRAWRVVTRLLENSPVRPSGLRLAILEPPAPTVRYLCRHRLGDA